VTLSRNLRLLAVVGYVASPAHLRDLKLLPVHQKKNKQKSTRCIDINTVSVLGLAVCTLLVQSQKRHNV